MMSLKPTQFDSFGQFVEDVKEQFRRNGRRLLILLIVVSSLFLSTIIASLLTDYPLEAFTRDVVATAGLPAYVGVISNLGIFCWAIAATVCFVGYIVVQKPRKTRRFLLFSSILSFTLGMDDLLLLHENVLPELLPFAEIGMYTLYAVALLLYIWNFYDQILSTEYVWFFLAAGLMAGSLLIDQIFPTATFLEDSFKFTGIAMWTTYFFTAVCRLIITNQK